MHVFSFRERFIGLPNPHTKGLYAPLTVGAPLFLNPVDYNIFKKSKEEKEIVADIRKQHKRDLIKSYGVGKTNRHMNP